MYRLDYKPVLAIRELSKTFLGTRALDRVDFDLLSGEVHALVGQNGSGKSTLIKVLAGFHQPDPGAEITVDGNRVEIADTAASRELGFRFVHQDLGLVPTLDTVENLALGREYQTGFAGRIRWAAERRDAEERVHALGYDFDVRKPVSMLGTAEQTGIAIARALSGWESARVLVVDEPTASLPRHEIKLLFEAIRRVSARGLGVIYVSHRLDEVFDIAQRVTVLRDGHKVVTARVSELDQEKLISLMVGGEQLASRSADSAQRDRPVVLEVDGLCGLVVDNVDLSARGGEVLGIAGLTGSGREEILPLIFGAVSRYGSVRVEGKEVRPERPSAAKDAGIALVPAHRHTQGSVPGMTVQENCTLTDLVRHSGRGLHLATRPERAEVQTWIETLDVRPQRPEAIFATLSGGNQQKVVLAKWLRMRPKLLLLDEPTHGVDVHAKATIHALAREAAASGAAVVIASSDEKELCDACDRVLVMRNGRIVGQLGDERLTSDAIARMELGTREDAA